jgi:predicted dehydrogenase
VIRAAIVGIGRWWRTLVSSVQGHSSLIRFTGGQTWTRGSAEAFCAEHGIALKDDLDLILANPAIDLFDRDVRDNPRHRHRISPNSSSPGPGYNCGF